MGQRFFAGVAKFLIYVLIIIIIYPVLFVGLLLITTLLSGNSLYMYAMNLEKDLATYVIAAATLEFAVLTLLQQHITRQQDRSLDFPNICIDGCMISVGSENIMSEIIGIEEYKGGYLISIFFNETFPVYYEPKIHRAWVIKTITQSEELIYKMEILSSFHKKEQNKVVWNIQVGELECLRETVRRSQVKGVQALKFIYDVSWENQLLPCYSRKLSKIYMKLIIFLEDAGKKKEMGCFFNVRGLEIKNATRKSPTPSCCKK